MAFNFWFFDFCITFHAGSGSKSGSGTEAGMHYDSGVNSAKAKSCCSCGSGSDSTTLQLKGQCDEIFCFWVYQLDRFEFFRKYAEIFASQGAPRVSTTPVTPVATFHRYQRHRRQIFHRCQRHQWQIMGTISGCSHLKVISYLISPRIFEKIPKRP